METAINGLVRKTQEDIAKNSRTILEEFAIEEYIEAIRLYPRSKNYFGVSSIVEDICTRILQKYNRQTLAMYQKLSLLMLMRQSLKKLDIKRPPASIVNLCLDWFARVMADLTIKADDYYHHKSEPFIDDLCCCSLRTIPIGGAWMIETTAIRKKLLMTVGLRHFLDFVVFIMFRAGGFKPFYRIHTLKRYSGGFSAEDRVKCYLRITELLKQYAEIKGMYVIGWFYDPNLIEISPSLAFLREVPARNGAKLFRFGTTEQTIRFATAWSPERKKLYEEGKYTPTEYALIWPKKEMLDWAEKQLKNN
jgi:hypothetical protein